MTIVSECFQEIGPGAQNPLQAWVSVVQSYSGVNRALILVPALALQKKVPPRSANEETLTAG